MEEILIIRRGNCVFKFMDISWLDLDTKHEIWCTCSYSASLPKLDFLCLR